MTTPLIPLNSEVEGAITHCLSEYYGITSVAEELPVNVERLLELAYGVSIVPAANLERDYETDAVLATDFKTIYVDLERYNDPRYDGRMRFSLAHELGHILLHKSFFLQSVAVIDEPSVQGFYFHSLNAAQHKLIERQAHSFASGVLMPYSNFVYDATALVRENLDLLYDNGLTVAQLLNGLSPRLAKAYAVSESAVEVRIDRVRLTELMALDPQSPINQTEKSTLLQQLNQLLASVELLRVR